MSEGLVLYISPEIDGQFTQGYQPSRTFYESVGGIFEIDSPDGSNGTYSIPDPTLRLTSRPLDPRIPLLEPNTAFPWPAEYTVHLNLPFHPGQAAGLTL